MYLKNKNYFGMIENVKKLNYVEDFGIVNYKLTLL